MGGRKCCGQSTPTCAVGNRRFGIQALNKHGNVEFHVGAQDIVDIISNSITRFGGSGKVGAKGKMDCRGLSTVRMLSGVYIRWEMQCLVR